MLLLCWVPTRDSTPVSGRPPNHSGPHSKCSHCLVIPESLKTVASGSLPITLRGERPRNYLKQQ
eukprot:5703533-Amphidinium_carterae.1